MQHNFRLDDERCADCGEMRFHENHPDFVIVSPASWSCIIGEIERKYLPAGSDFPMRLAVSAAYFQVTGKEANFCFSGWGSQLTPSQRKCVEGKV